MKMIKEGNRMMPKLMRELHQLEFDYADGQGIDFEPYHDFLSPEETSGWFRAWTGNEMADASQYLVFGQDGTGGYAAIWRIRDEQDLLEQPIVFFGSEGELGIVAQNFTDYLWLLAGGHSPYEAVADPSDEQSPQPAFTEFARLHAATPQEKPSRIISKARAEFPDFAERIRTICR